VLSDEQGKMKMMMYLFISFVTTKKR